jgi:hypothetical protein
MTRSFRNVLVVVAVGCGSAALAATVPVMASGRGAASPPPPPIVVVGTQGGQPLPDETSSIAFLSLPPGKWTVTVKTYLHNPSGDSTVHCDLQVGNGLNIGSEDSADQDMRGSIFNSTMTLSAAGPVLQSDGALLRCGDGGGSAVTVETKLTAIKAGKLTVKQL